MTEATEILHKLQTQVERIMIDEVCSPAESKLVNALAVLIATLLHERDPGVVKILDTPGEAPRHPAWRSGRDPDPANQ